MLSLNKHLLVLVGLSLVTIAAYVPGVPAYFCGSDDYLERHRVAFVDARYPSKILTTSYFNGMRYRPVSRAVRYLSYRIAGDNPKWYRIRNVSFHVINVMLVYGIGFLLLESRAISAVAALLFGVHPLANQTVMGAFWTNSMEHTAFLGSLLLFLGAARRPGGWRLRFTLAMLLALLGIFSYDPAIAVFGVMGVYLVCFFFEKGGRAYPRGLFPAFILSVIAIVVVYVGVRLLLVPHTLEHANRQPFLMMAKNTVIFLGALTPPLDWILANRWFGTPLPSDLNLQGSHAFVIRAAIIGMVLLPIVGYFLLRRLRSNSKPLQGVPFDWRKVVLLVAAIMGCLLPLLVFRRNLSEAYMYLPAAFYSLLLSYVGAYLLLPRGGHLAGARSRAYWTVSAVFFILGVSATYVRNQLIVDCGELAQHLEAGFRRELADGRVSHVIASPTPIPISTRYAFYRFQGIQAITGGTFNSKGLAEALQLVMRNERLSVELVPPEELETACLQENQSDRGCFWVYPDGEVERYRAPQPSAKGSASAAGEVRQF